MGLIIFLSAALVGALALVALVSFVWNVVAETVRRRMKDKGSDKTMVIGKEEMGEITEQMRAHNPRAASKLDDMLRADEKLALYDVGDSYQVEALDAKDKSRDDFEHGGVIFENNGFIYGKNGERLRQVG
ncbi:MAG: hypothetical protein J6K20_01430 [Thermoguttaceae bacterium]|nr:hypothetical protein [Thermoguttaceae bacterium]